MKLCQKIRNFKYKEESKLHYNPVKIDGNKVYIPNTFYVILRNNLLNHLSKNLEIKEFYEIIRDFYERLHHNELYEIDVDLEAAKYQGENQEHTKKIICEIIGEEQYNKKEIPLTKPLRGTKVEVITLSEEDYIKKRRKLDPSGKKLEFGKKKSKSKKSKKKKTKKSKKKSKKSKKKKSKT